MADMLSAINFLREFALSQGDSNPLIGVDNMRPHYRAPDGTLYGVLFGKDHAGNPQWERGPAAIIKFPSGALSSRNWVAVKWLTATEPSGTAL